MLGFRKCSERADGQDDLERRIIEEAVAIPVRLTNEQTEAMILAGPLSVLGEPAVEAMPAGEQAMVASDCWLGYGLRMAEVRLVDGAHDPENERWVGVAGTAVAAMNAHDADDLGPAMVSAAGLLCEEPSRQMMYGSVPGLSADRRGSMISHCLDDLGADGAAIRRPDREMLIAYGFAVAAVREWLRAAKEPGQTES